jgi:hypothetical protein
LPDGPITLLDDPALAAIVRRCYTDAEFVDQAGTLGRGYTNLKRIFGSPADVRAVVDALASTVGAAEAVASADTGSAPLAALVAYERSLPAVFVRISPKEDFLSYGGDPETTIPGSSASGSRRERSSTSSTTSFTRVRLLRPRSARCVRRDLPCARLPRYSARRSRPSPAPLTRST